MLSIDRNSIVIEHYDKILYIADTCIRIITNGGVVEIHGENLQVVVLEKDEIRMEGIVRSLIFHEEV